MTEYTATRHFELTDGRHYFAWGEVRYTFTVTPGRKAVVWADTMSGNYSAAEKPDVEITDIYWRTGKYPNSKWIVADDQLYAMLAEVPDAWLLEQAREQAE